jgi:hypothetical protein
MKSFVVKTPFAMWRAAGLGNVITHQDHRQRGYSSKVIEACLEEARRQGVDFVILWSELHDFYRKFGFELVGFEEHLTIPVGFKAGTRTQPIEELTPSNYKFVNESKICPQALHRLYNNHTLGVVRTAEEIRKFLEIPNAQIWSAWDNQNQLKAYAISGKGLDLQGYIHEWGGSVSALLALMEKISSETKKPFKVISPATSVNFISALLKRGATFERGYLGMIKIINRDSFLAKITRAAHTLNLELRFLSESQTGRAQTGESIQMEYLRAGQLVYEQSFNSSQELLRFVFGPSDWPNNKVAPKELKSLFPLPLWFWGWDSV